MARPSGPPSTRPATSSSDVMELSTPARIATFATGLVVVFATALGVGHAVGPVVDAPADDMASHADDPMGGEHAEGTEHLPGGLMVSQDGYTLVLDETAPRPASRCRSPSGCSAPAASP